MNKKSEWPMQYLKANFKVIEQDLYTYRLMKQKILTLLEELEKANTFEPGLKAVQPNDLYISKEKIPFKRYIESHNVIHPRSNPTENQAFMDIHWESKKKFLTTLLSGTQYAEMNRRVETIEYVLQRLEVSNIAYEKKKAELVKARYFEQRLAPVGLAEEFNISLGTVYNWSNDVIKEIASCLGFMVG